MRRILGYAAFTFGLVLVFLAPLLYFYAAPRVEKAPYDVYDRTVSVGTGSYLYVKTLMVVGPAQIVNISIAKGDPERSTHDVAVVGIFSRTLDALRGDFDYSYDVYAFDRSTGYGVDCCGANPVASGLTLKFPFGTDRATYPFWDSTARQPFPARYTRTERIEGLDAFVFVSEVPPTMIKSEVVPGFLVGQKDRKSITVDRIYRATTTLWVEPTTGAILKAGQHAEQWFAHASGARLLTVADIAVTNDEASVLDTVRQVKDQLWQLRLVSVWLPIVGPVVGLILIATGWWLLHTDGPTERPTPTASDDGPQDNGATASAPGPDAAAPAAHTRSAVEG